MDNRNGVTTQFASEFGGCGVAAKLPHHTPPFTQIYLIPLCFLFFFIIERDSEIVQGKRFYKDS